MPNKGMTNQTDTNLHLLRDMLSPDSKQCILMIRTELLIYVQIQDISYICDFIPFTIDQQVEYLNRIFSCLICKENKISR